MNHQEEIVSKIRPHFCRDSATAKNSSLSFQPNNVGEEVLHFP
jgi:hypothetical protein